MHSFPPPVTDVIFSCAAVLACAFIAIRNNHFRHTYTHRLPIPVAPRLSRSGGGPARTVAAVAAAAAGATAARSFFSAATASSSNSKRGRKKAAAADSRNGSNTNLLARLGARGVLAARLASDVASAAAASMMVSPFISIVDRAIIQSASGTMGMQASVAQGVRVLLTKPALFLARPDFVCTFCLYGATCKYLIPAVVVVVVFVSIPTNLSPIFQLMFMLQIL